MSRLGSCIRRVLAGSAFGSAELRRLIFIRRARELGFEIEAIRRLLALQDMPERSCEEVDAMSRGHLA